MQITLFDRCAFERATRAFTRDEIAEYVAMSGDIDTRDMSPAQIDALIDEMYADEIDACSPCDDARSFIVDVDAQRVAYVTFGD